MAVKSDNVRGLHDHHDTLGMTLCIVTFGDYTSIGQGRDKLENATELIVETESWLLPSQVHKPKKVTNNLY